MSEQTEPVTTGPLCIEVASDAVADGAAPYVLTVSVGPDVSFSLTQAGAHRYAAAVIRAGVVAEYDAGMLAQLRTDLEMPDPMIAAILRGVRDARGPLDHASTYPLTFRPVVAVDSKAYLLMIGPAGPIAQITPKDAFEHAANVSEMIDIVDLDTAYLRVMADRAGLDERRARKMVGGVGAHMSDHFMYGVRR